ncbi:sensor histidine kinase [Cryptosporangium sp. NPDC048952]|uniref:sensor histidine kinase n=1 Tax=Cryptosporangium sp. NPDC048952 TaxID=3363961 RepID=UPI003711261D
MRRHRELLVDLLIAALVVFLGLQSEQTVEMPWRFPLAAIGVVAILLRRRYPTATLVVVTGIVAVGVMFGHLFPALALLLGVLMYSVALELDGRRPWLYAFVVSATICLPGLFLYFSEWWGLNSLALPVWVFGGAAIGDSARSRRAYVAEVMERARQAELTREEEARRRVIDERLRIARELHDVVAHHIAVISVQAGAATHVLRSDPEQVWPVLTHIRSAADTVLTEIQSVVGVLRDPNEVTSTEPTPGMDRLPALLEDFRAMGFRVSFSRTGESAVLPTITDITAFRIVQEALTNAHRYGDGAASLTVTFDAEELSIEVANRTRPAATAGSGFGLLGMHERASAAHGTLTAGPTTDGAFRVHATLPIGARALASGSSAEEDR